MSEFKSYYSNFLFLRKGLKLVQEYLLIYRDGVYSHGINRFPVFINYVKIFVT
jgi:hypothetical protein